MKNSLSVTGLSLSQAQSISNLCYQRAQEIANQLNGINNATKTVKIGGDTYQETVGKPIPTNIVELINEKAQLHAVQAFLMENIKAKDQLLSEIKHKPFRTDITAPEKPKFIQYEGIKGLVDETWGKEQLSVSEICECIEQEALAAHIGQFIHKDSPLDKLRLQLPKVKTLEFITVKDGEKTPVKVEVHHTPAQLLAIHEKLAKLHRTYEMRVNYFKAKIKNLVTEENASISRNNAVITGKTDADNMLLADTYKSELKVFTGKVEKARQEFEGERMDLIKSAAALRILVDPRFQPVIDKFTKDLETPDKA